MRLCDATHFLGKTVKVTLDYDTNNPQAIVTGRLLAFADSGEVKVEDEMGFVHYCWPMLKVEEVG